MDKTKTIATGLNEQEKKVLKYYDMLCLLNDIKAKNAGTVLMLLSKVIIEGEKNELVINSYQKEKIGQVIGLSLPRINQLLHILVKANLLYSAGKRSVYFTASSVFPQSH